MTPDTLVRLANLAVARLPAGGSTIHPDPFASPASAMRALSLPWLDASQVDSLEELHTTVVELVDGLLAGDPVAGPAARLTKLAQPSVASVRLDAGEPGMLHARLEWSEPTPTATLARRVALELGEIDAARLKRCERPACDLVFYDTTRSGTRRWHAESPCGTRERQRRHRAGANCPRPTSA